jgi:hypothetical protein
MGSINPTYNDRVRYTLKNKNMGSLIVTEPIGWQTDEKELARHEEYHGIMAKFSNSLKFIHSGADYIQFVKDVYGINEQIELLREEKHPRTDEWTFTYSGFLDLSTWQRENNQVAVKFNSGGIEQLLKSRESNQVEIDRLTTMDGQVIPELNPISVELSGRRIFLKTKYEKDKGTSLVTLDVQSDAGNTRRVTTGFPLKLVNKSHENAQNTIYGSEGSSNAGETGIMFFAVSDRVRHVKVKGEKIQFKPVVTAWDFDWAIISVCLTTYKDGVAYNLKSRDYLFSSQNLPGSSFGQIVQTHNQLREINFDKNITLLEGESLALEFYIEADLSSGSNRHFRVDFTEMKGNLFVDEDSFFEKTTTKAVLAHELGERLIRIATNEEKGLYSEFLGRTDIGYSTDGKGALTAITHGFWVRGFDKLPLPSEGPPKIENMFKPMTTSFKDYISSLSAVWNVGLGIEKIGKGERIRIEDKKYFYNRNVLIKLPNQVKNVKRTVATDKYYSALEFGYEFPVDYEEACGLDEYNAKTNFSTVISRITKTYSALSKYVAAVYAIEFARRKQKYLNDTEDTRYDNLNFLLDVKRGISNIFQQRKWQDDFSQEPKGVFSPETATNLRFSPFNCFLRHTWWFSGGFKTYMSDYVRYGSSTANSNLKTKLIGGNEYAENQDIINSELQTALFLPEEIEFEYECTFDVMQMVEGTTKILGKEIPNFYGTVEFINEKNELERGFLFNLKPNGKGQWKLLKANR